ncbi:HPr(Ser) kinase/phosphatase [Caldicellulosiruptoraceae bacterium PP1]
MFYTTVAKLVKELSLENLSGLDNLEQRKIKDMNLNRPALQLMGFFEHFDIERVQIIGMSETAYLKTMSEEQRKNAVEKLFTYNIPCVIITTNLEPYPEFIEFSKKYNVPLLRTKEVTTRFMTNLSTFLSHELAPRITRHGTLVNVYGEGVLMLGESGVGKSETALELVKRGHILVADDAVEIRKLSEKTLVGEAPEIIRHLLEIRGIGILDVKNLFGVGCVKESERIDLVIQLENWRENKEYERLGLHDQFIDILGIQVPSLIIPVRPGRNLAIIVEVAAMNNRQKKMGYNAAKALSERLLNQMNKTEKV